MKKLLFAFSLSAAIAMPAMAADQSKLSVGAGYGFNYNGVLSLHADYDIADQVNNAPVKARFGYDSYSRDYAGPSSYSWGYNVFYAGAYYDFNKQLKLDNKIHPYAGLGLGFGTVSCSGTPCNGLASPTVGGLYVLIGLQYDVKPDVSLEANINGWNGLSLGANYKF